MADVFVIKDSLLRQIGMMIGSRWGWPAEITRKKMVDFEKATRCEQGKKPSRN
jgi:hypothetical protein